MDVEWKYARTKLYMDYLRTGSTLAVPFNIMPSWKSIYSLWVLVVKCCCCCCRNKQEDNEEDKKISDNCIELTDPSGNVSCFSL